MKNKILIFNGFYPDVKGGAEFQARIIADLCLANNQEVVFISIQNSPYEVKITDNIKIYVLPNPNNAFSNATLYYFFMKKVLKIIDKEKPSIVYQRILNSFSPYLAKYCYRVKVPFLLHIANTHCFSFSNSIRDKVRFFLFNQLKKHPVIYIAQTKEQELLLKQHGLKVSLILSNMINVQPTLKQEQKEPLKIIWIGNIRPIKQVELFFDLAKSLVDLPLQFFVIGRIEDKSQKTNYLSEMSAIQNLKYLGELTTSEVTNLLKNAFLLVNTSKSEGFSNTFVQSWSTGTPVLSLNSNPNDFLTKYNTGILAEGDVNKLKEAITDFVSDRNKYKEYSKKASLLFDTHLSFSKSSAKLLGLINEKLTN